jgi:hypothetical protein
LYRFDRFEHQKKYTIKITMNKKTHNIYLMVGLKAASMAASKVALWEFLTVETMAAYLAAS